MEKIAHTPGPVETLARLAIQSERYAQDAEFRDAVDGVLGKPIYDAAPMMFEALEVLMAVGPVNCPCTLREIDSGHLVDCNAPEAEMAYDKARAALAAAKGESK